jgi:hypothetical protein
VEEIMTSECDVYPELKRIENEIHFLKLMLLKGRVSPKKIVKLQSTLKSHTTEKELEDAKKSVFGFNA